MLLIIYRSAVHARWLGAWITGASPLARVTSWAVLFHLTCYGWLIFRAGSGRQIADLTAAIIGAFEPSAIDVRGLLVPLVGYVTPLILVHGIEARYDDLLVVPKLPPLVRYSVYAATFYLTILFGNFGGSEFIYFQF
jgi:hypothetical protein